MWLKKMYLSLGGIAGLVPSASCVSRQVTWGSGLQGALWGGGALSPSAQGSVDGGAPLAAGSWSHSIPHSLSVNLSSASFPGAVLRRMRFSGRPRGKAERHQFRVSREALRASVSSSVKWGQQSFSPVWSCQLCSGAPACLLTSTLPPLHSVMSFWWLGVQREYFHHMCVRVCVCAHACVCASSIT